MSVAPTLVIGTGLVGASVGCALTEAGYRVYLQDVQPAHAQVAAGLGAGTTEHPDPGDVALVVAAVPPATLPETIVNALRTYPHATVTDVGSVKAGILDMLWDSGADLRRYVGSHPMAGSQLSGPLTARADLFRDRTWVIAPHRRSGAGPVTDVEQLVKISGAEAVRMDVAVHDAAVARVSHLPYLMSVLMAQRLNDTPPDQLQLAGQGLRDVTRIAASNPALWQQILGANSAALLPELRAVQGQLSDLIESVAADRGSGARTHLDRGLAGTRRISGKHGKAPARYEHVVVEIPDAPGALSRLFADVGEAGVNVEDISIEHDQVRQVGYLSLAVEPDQCEALLASIAASGWSPAHAGEDADPPV